MRVESVVEIADTSRLSRLDTVITLPRSQSSDRKVARPNEQQSPINTDRLGVNVIFHADRDTTLYEFIQSRDSEPVVRAIWIQIAAIDNDRNGNATSHTRQEFCTNGRVSKGVCHHAHVASRRSQASRDLLSVGAFRDKGCLSRHQTVYRPHGRQHWKKTAENVCHQGSEM